MTSPQAIEVLLATPRGFCAGVERAIDIVELALEKHGAPVYVRHEIVHNKRVVETLRAKGAVFVEELDEVPPGAVTIFSAHGVSRRVENDADGRQLEVIDATCPLVRKVHKEGQRYASRDFDVIMIGHLGHPEVEGTLGQIDGRVHVVDSAEDVAGLDVRDPDKVSYVTQTTLSVSDTKDVIAAIRGRFPNVVGPDTRDICYATQNRQTAALDLAREADMILVVGAENSSNSTRLREIAEHAGVPSKLTSDATELARDWLEGVNRVGITAGASAPETLVSEVIAKLSQWCDVTVRELQGVHEGVHFRLPPELEGVRQAAE